MKMKLAVLLTTAALAAPAAAQSSTSATQGSTSVAQSSTSTSGVVVSSTTESLVVRMDDGTQRTFNVTTSTTVPSARLAAGNRVTVHYRPLEAGLFEAARVELAAALNPDRTAPTPSDRSMMSETAATQGSMTATQREMEAQREAAATEGSMTASQRQMDAQRQTDAQRRTDTTQRDTTTGMERDTTTATQRENARIQGETNEEREALPATASPMPLLALSGLAALVAGLVMKARRTA